MASAASSYSTTPKYEYSPDSNGSKFSHYRRQLMLGDLPEDFLRVKISEPLIIPPDTQPAHQGYAQTTLHPNFLGFLTLTIAEARLVKGSGMLGLVKADPYVSFRIGHVQHETATASGGGKNPQWKASYRLNLFRGMDRIYFQVFDQRSFTEDSLIGECEVIIPHEVMEGETRQNWYPLYTRDSKDTQGDILIVMSFASARVQSASTGASPEREKSGASASSTGASNSPTKSEASVMPKRSTAPYSQDDIKTIEEMFPTTDRQLIIELLEKNDGNKDLVVNHLLQNFA